MPPYAFPPFTFTSTHTTTTSQQPASTTTPVTMPYSVPTLNDAGKHDFVAPIVSQAESSVPFIIDTVLSNKDAPSPSSDSNASTYRDNENILAPVVEKAAFQLAKLLRVSDDAVSKKEAYPFTDFWQDTIKRLSNDVNVGRIISHARTASMNKLRPILDHLRSARNSIMNYN
ncbi:hypothetical protein COOONC_27893 [Cooperia oncophora]